MGTRGDSAVIYYVSVNIVRSMVLYYVCCRMICIYIYILILYIYSVQYHTKCGFI